MLVVLSLPKLSNITPHFQGTVIPYWPKVFTIILWTSVFDQSEARNEQANILREKISFKYGGKNKSEQSGTKLYYIMSGSNSDKGMLLCFEFCTYELN